MNLWTGLPWPARFAQVFGWRHASTPLHTACMAALMNTPQWMQDYADGHVFYRGHPPDGSAASKQWLLSCVEWADMELGWKMSADEMSRVSAAHERIYMLPRCKDGCAQ